MIDKNENYSLPRKNMLKVRGDISRGFKFGIPFKGEYLRIIAIPPGVIRCKPGRTISDSSDLNKIPQFAVLVNKKCGKAFQRNRLKRIAREYFRVHKNCFLGLWAVIFSMEKAPDNEKLLKSEISSLTEKCRERIPLLMKKKYEE